MDFYNFEYSNVYMNYPHIIYICMQFQYTLTIIMSVIMSKPFIISMQVILPVLINKPFKGVQITYICVNDFKYQGRIISHTFLPNQEKESKEGDLMSHTLQLTELVQLAWNSCISLLIPLDTQCHA